MIYLDHHATTPLEAGVLQAMLPALRGPGNAAAIQHSFGWRAKAMLDDARSAVTCLLDAPSAHVVFTSGATEANNLALLGLAASAPTSRRRIVTSEVEHPSVAASLARLANHFEIVPIPVGPDGRIDLNVLADVVDHATWLISIQTANGEIGTIQPMAEIEQIARRHDVLLHTDAAQAAGAIPLESAADAVTLSAHKMSGPQGAGALVLSRRARDALRPQILGGGQEDGLRSGTTNVAGAVGLGAACHLALEGRTAETVRLGTLRDQLNARLSERLVITVNGSQEHRLSANLNVRLHGVDADALMATCPQVAMSAGSACAAANRAPSQVLQAIGLTAEEADESVRFGLGRTSCEADIDDAANFVIAASNRILDPTRAVA